MEPRMDLEKFYKKLDFKHFIVYHSVVEEVEAKLQYAAHAGRHSDRQLNLICFVVGYIFFRKCSDKSGQEVVSGIDLAH